LHFIISGLQIVLIDLLLAGDNALIIAMAVRSLPPKERRIGIICGAGAAVLLRVGLTFIAGMLLNIQYVQLAGGLLVLWIAVKVLRESGDPDHQAPTEARFWEAIRYIVVADITMSTDNVLAIAGASHGNFGLILFGLALSIPFIVFSSNLLSRLMDKYPWTIWVGAGILGKVGGEMMMTDPVVVKHLHPSHFTSYALQAVLTLGLILVGRMWTARKEAAVQAAVE